MSYHRMKQNNIGECLHITFVLLSQVTSLIDLISSIISSSESCAMADLYWIPRLSLTLSQKFLNPPPKPVCKVYRADSCHIFAKHGSRYLAARNRQGSATDCELHRDRYTRLSFPRYHPAQHNFHDSFCSGTPAGMEQSISSCQSTTCGWGIFPRTVDDGPPGISS